MSELRIYEDNNADKLLSTADDFVTIRDQLAGIGVLFERWDASKPLDAESGQDEVIEAYRSDIDRLMKRFDFQSVDVISMYPTHPQRDVMREKFLNEHTHDDFEVRFFVDGAGLFNLHANGRLYAMLCTKGDLISVPAGTSHWFDMGPAPSFKAIRLFTTPEGWVAKFTGDPIAERFPRLESPHYPLDAAA